jgi:hypothetical protein
MDYSFIVGYFVVGGWQVISMLVHAKNHWFIGRGRVRSNYHWIVCGIFITAGIGYFINDVLAVLLYIMIIAAPVMAVYYTVLCYDESYVKMQRPMEFLK